MERLSGLDASFLYLETSAQLLHVCGVILLDPETIPGGYSYDDVQGRARAPDRRRPDVPPQAQAGAARHRPPGVGRPTTTSTSTGTCTGWRCPRPGGDARARRPVRPHRRHPAGPLAAAVGVLRDRGARVRQGRGVHQDAPLDRGRRLGRQRDLLHVQPRAGRPAAGDARPRASAAATPGDAELFARGRGHQPDQAGAGRQAGRARRPACSPGPSAAPAAVRRWPRR